MVSLASFWAGGPLGPIELASVRSFLRCGMELTVFGPTPIANLPEGAFYRPSSEIFPDSPLYSYRGSNSPALHSDLFRYQMLAQTEHVWVDMDVVALKPFDFDSGWIFGFERESYVNNAVLRLPPQSETLACLNSIDRTARSFPPGMKGRKLHGFWLESLGRGKPIGKWPWGALGPAALTHFLARTGEIRHALPQQAFYPVHWRDTQRLAAPGGLRRADLPGDTYAVHLWAQILRRVLVEDHGGQVPKDSFLSLALAGET